jgi:hypothetical protein
MPPNLPGKIKSRVNKLGQTKGIIDVFRLKFLTADVTRMVDTASKEGVSGAGKAREESTSNVKCLETFSSENLVVWDACTLR